MTKMITFLNRFCVMYLRSLHVHCMWLLLYLYTVYIYSHKRGLGLNRFSENEQGKAKSATLQTFWVWGKALHYHLWPFNAQCDRIARSGNPLWSVCSNDHLADSQLMRSDCGPSWIPTGFWLNSNLILSGFRF